MGKQSGLTGSVSFWRNLFHTAAAQQREVIQQEIQRLEALTTELCRAIEPLVEIIERDRVTPPSFCGCIQVLRALETRKHRLELFNEVDSREELFCLDKVLSSPLIVLSESTNQNQIKDSYGIEPDNLNSFVELIVSALNEERRSERKAA